MNLFDIYRQWETDLRPYTVDALRRMAPEQLAYKPEGWHSSAWDLADHMVGCEWIWISRNVLQRAPWGTRWQANRFGSMDQLLAFWEQVHGETVEWMKSVPAAELEREIAMPYEGMPTATVQWLVYHVMEHEIHHRGQIFMLMRMQGITPPEI